MQETSAAPLSAAPAWVRITDALSLTLLAAAIWTFFSGGYRGVLFGVPISQSPLHAFLGFVVVGTIRHAINPQPSLLDRAQGWRNRWQQAHDVGAAAAAFSTRLLVLLVGYFSVVTIGLAPEASGLRSSRDALADLAFRYDAGWYAGIAVSGYDHSVAVDSQRNIAFFPAYPMLMRALGGAVGMYGVGMPGDARMVRALWSGVAISLAAFFLAMLYLFRLARDLLGEERARATLILLAAYPFAVFFSAAYTESLFLLGSVATFYHFRRAEWIPAALWGLLVGLTRPNGCFLSVPLAMLAVSDWRHARHHAHAVTEHTNDWLWTLGRPLLAAAAPAVGMLAFTAYLWHVTGVWFAWRVSHLAWGRSFQGIEPLLNGLELIESRGLLRVVATMPIDTLNALALLFSLALIGPVFKHVGATWALFVVINLVPPLMAGGLMSIGRVTSTLFPIYLALAALLPPRAVPAWAVGFGLLQGLVAVLFFTWRHLV